MGADVEETSEMNAKSQNGSWIEKPWWRPQSARRAAMAALVLGSGAGLTHAQWGSPAPSARVECLGSGAPRARIVIEGGKPFGVALLSARGPCGKVVQLLALDGEGGYVRELSPGDLDAAREIELLVHDPLAGSGASASVTPWKRLNTPGSGPGTIPGKIVITEIMKDPKFVPDASGEWFEVLNTSTLPVSLAGWTISDLGSNQHVLPSGGSAPVVGPGQRLVLGNQDIFALNGGVQVDYKYSGITLSNGADEVLLRDANGTLIDMLAYGDGPLWPDSAGIALNLAPPASSTLLNDDPANWCDAQLPFHPVNPDLGTPGQPNTACP